MADTMRDEVVRGESNTLKCFPEARPSVDIDPLAMTKLHD